MRGISLLALSITLTLGAADTWAACFCLVDNDRTLYRDCVEGYRGAARTPYVECRLKPGSLREEIPGASSMKRVPAGEPPCDPCEVQAHARPRPPQFRLPDDTGSIPAKSAQPPELTAPSEGVRIRASRLFAGREQYPPKEFPAYGLVAFRSLPTAHDRARYLLVCEAYAATLPHADDLSVARTEQMVTVWPVRSANTADALNGRALDAVGVTGACNVAVDAFDLVVAQQAIREAKDAIREAEPAGAPITLSGRGPYLLAWSPGMTKGSRDAPPLVADLSEAETYKDVHAVFLQWANDIEENPELWREGEGWNLAKVRVLIREWADRWGPPILSFVSGAS